MKCPKCGYLGFERVDRCRNCGYDFSMAPPAADPELPLKMEAEERGPLEDLSFLDRDNSLPLSRFPAESGPDLDRLIGVPSTSAELPLFGVAMSGDAPLITRASPPRPPLAVRRATPEVPRLRVQQPRPQTLDLTADAEAPRMTNAPAVTVRSGTDERLGDRAIQGEDATIAARFGAVVIDLIILAVIDLAVVYFTMQICGIGLGELHMLPLGPLVAFLLVQNGGYLVAFTAGGQTLGKMALGIKVVSTERQPSVDLGTAFVRELLWVALAIPAGLGLLTTLFSRDHRGLHDRFARTRVVRASL